MYVGFIRRLTYGDTSENPIIIILKNFNCNFTVLFYAIIIVSCLLLISIHLTF